MDTPTRETLSPEKQLEICNAVNTAVATGKIVTMNSLDYVHAIQIAGAFPNVDGVILVAHLDWSPNSVPILWLNNKYIIRVYSTCGTDMDTIHTPQDVETLSESNLAL